MDKIVIDPISRIEGEGKVTIYVGADNEVVKTRFQMMEFRAFEEFVKGRMIWEMPLIMSKICGICPVPHQLAAVKAVEDALDVKEIPSTALLLRKLILAGGAIQDHALHFLYLAFPDFIFGVETPPAKRSVAGLLEENPELAKKAIFLRKCGVRMVEMIGGNAIYPVTAVPGGMTKSFSSSDALEIEKMYLQGLAIAEECVELAWKIVRSEVKDRYPQNILRTKYLSLVSPQNGLSHYDGQLRICDERGNPLETFPASDYPLFIEEDVERDSWAKFPFLRKLGRHEGIYRVGPLARLNTVDWIYTEKAGRWLERFREIGQGQSVHDIIYYHLARCIELLYEFEQSLELLKNEAVTGSNTRIPVARKAGEGIGIVEAPRGTLIHHYWCGHQGEITRTNLIVPTTHNNVALNHTVTAAAKQVVVDGNLDEAGQQQIEMAVRAYDPCLSCATHSWDADHRLKVEIIRVTK